MPQSCIFTPIGEITLTEEDGALVALDWGRGAILEPSPLLTEAEAQLRAYFSGNLTQFDLPFRPAGTAFQHRLWQALSQIAYGQTQTYGNLAANLSTSAQAVGGACGANPLPILIPCHRVLAANGALGGYSGDGGPETKAFLLALEQIPSK